ncbi:MAG: hypothetical protein KTR16_00915 [Acidiferrobacterales bacterium]|nr:hypothetical protein [Acidiferrobacterales bacterium]
MSIYAVPAIVAFSIKLFFVYFYRKNLEVNHYLLAMVLVFACHNLFEVLIFWQFSNGIAAEYLLRAYYVASLISLTVIATYASNIGYTLAKIWQRGLFLAVVLMSGIILATDFIVSGSTSISYSTTALRGDFYWLFQVSSIAILSVVIGLLVRGYIKSDSHETEIRCAYAGLALLPHFIAVFVIILMMNLGFNLNAAMVMPLATTMFLFILLASEKKHRMTDIRRFIPFSEERQTANQIMEIFSRYARDEANYRDAVSDIEKLLVEHKYQKNDYNASSAAQLMGMPRSSLYSLFNRLDIKRD